MNNLFAQYFTIEKFQTIKMKTKFNYLFLDINYLTVLMVNIN